MLPRPPVFRHSGDDTIMKEHIMKIANAGATGRLGRHVNEVLAGGSHEVVAMSRATGVDRVAALRYTHPGEPSLTER